MEIYKKQQEIIPVYNKFMKRAIFGIVMNLVEIFFVSCSWKTACKNIDDELETSGWEGVQPKKYVRESEQINISKGK